jgi:hypothetical protein
MMTFRSRRYRLNATLYASYSVVSVTGGGVSQVARYQLVDHLTWKLTDIDRTANRPI